MHLFSSNSRGLLLKQTAAVIGGSVSWYFGVCSGFGSPYVTTHNARGSTDIMFGDVEEIK